MSSIGGGPNNHGNINPSGRILPGAIAQITAPQARAIVAPASLQTKLGEATTPGKFFAVMTGLLPA